jgi:prepilin-type N-terminal cleavage/methylation domain-containing protein
MTITTQRASLHSSSRRKSGFTLPELLITLVVSSIILAAVFSSYIFLAKSCISIMDYSEMDTEARNSLEIFSREVRQAQDISGFSINGCTLEVPMLGSSYTVAYTYVPADKTFYRAYGTSNQKELITGIEAFSLQRFNLKHLTAANDLETKQLQLDVRSERSGNPKFSASNNVLSARFIMRNKQVSN